MTRSAAPGDRLACRSDPDRWFDRGNRTAALCACLSCPERRACAKQALRVEATWGMWAGVWIDGRHDRAARRLAEIAWEPPPGVLARPQVRPPVAPPPPPPPLPARAPLQRCTAAVAVTARSSGHCEVMAVGCRVTTDRLVCRITARDHSITPSAAELYYSCASCHHMISATERFARHGGYLVDSAPAAASTPFLWRGTRWVFLGPAGELHEVRDCTVDCA